MRQRYIPNDPVTPLLGIPRRNVYKFSSMEMLKATLLITVKNWKQAKCTSTDK